MKKGSSRRCCVQKKHADWKWNGRGGYEGSSSDGEQSVLDQGELWEGGGTVFKGVVYRKGALPSQLRTNEKKAIAENRVVGLLTHCQKALVKQEERALITETTED